jgi:predicted RNase H-like HicB family nuclease
LTFYWGNRRRHGRIKFTRAMVDGTGMERADDLVLRYRIILDREADHLFVANCLELPEVRAHAISVDAAVETLRATLAARVGVLRREGGAPTPVREFEGRLGAWQADLELIAPAAPARQGRAKLEKPVPSALRAIAQWTADRYRVVLEGDEDCAFLSASPEMPAVLGRGATAGDAVSDLRRQLADEAFRMLNAGAFPPEPLQDVEARGTKGYAAKVA